MRNLLPGIVDFRVRVLPKMGLEIFRQLARKQQMAESLFIACSDSRMVPNLFVSTNPGELFVVRNIGNVVPKFHHHKHTDSSVGAAIEFSNYELKVRDIIVCGHSECGAMKALLENNPELYKTRPHLFSWLQYAQDSFHKLKNNQPIQYTSPHSGKQLIAHIDSNLPLHNQLSQINVLQQVEHLAAYKVVRERIARGELMLHAWWFDIAQASVFSFSENKCSFVVIDENKAIELLQRAKETKDSIKQRIAQRGEIPPWILNKEHFERSITAPWSNREVFQPSEELLKEINTHPQETSSVMPPWLQRESLTIEQDESGFDGSNDNENTNTNNNNNSDNQKK